MELPKEFKGTIYFYYWTVINEVRVCDTPRDDPEFILLDKKEIEAEFNVSREQAVNQLVTNLNQQKKTIQANAQRELNQIDDRINSLLAITHQS